ncbi:MAG: ribonuclease HII [Candidatus Pacebacteria bacterium]|nr:ribonuclease HII [Candidatus Paceibacterota bacterium]
MKPKQKRAKKIVKKAAKLSQEFLIGIDEVGRGPLAGPVTVCAVAVQAGFDFSVLRELGLRDSKKMKASDRENIVSVAKKLEVYFYISHVSAQTIDKIGIVPSIRHALKNSLEKVLGKLNLEFKTKNKLKILLDGGLKAPTHFKNQKTIIRGDDSQPIISLASVLAKVNRDKKMQLLAKKYPKYGFEKHKGYGTKAHYMALNKHGKTPIHRLTFI